LVRVAAEPTGYMDNEKKSRKGIGGRPRKGTLEFRGKTWHARLTVTVDGESVRKWFDLGTDNKAVARRKLNRLNAETLQASPAVALKSETVDDYAGPWLASRKDRGVASADYERTLYDRIWKPALGSLELGAKGVGAIVRGVLEQAAAGKLMPPKRKGRTAAALPYSRQTIVHIRAVIFRLFDAAWRDELLAENPIARVSVPEMEQSGKARTILTDDEIGLLVRHPLVDSEIKMLVLISRTIGGLRAGDLGALDWTAFSPDFGTCTFVRRKTRKKRPRPETHAVPDVVRGFLKAWHDAQQNPSAGPVFPARRGPRAGKPKKMSNGYAKVLRRALLKAGVDRHELHHETATTLPVDFHSTRRAYATAIVGSGASDRETMKMGGWSSAALITRYDQKDNVRVLPAAAVPILITPPENRPVSRTELADDLFCAGVAWGELCCNSSENFGAGHGSRTRDLKLGKLALYQLS
jgi:integrase